MRQESYPVVERLGVTVLLCFALSLSGSAYQSRDRVLCHIPWPFGGRNVDFGQNQSSEVVQGHLKRMQIPRLSMKIRAVLTFSTRCAKTFQLLKRKVLLVLCSRFNVYASPIVEVRCTTRRNMPRAEQMLETRWERVSHVMMPTQCVKNSGVPANNTTTHLTGLSGLWSDHPRDLESVYCNLIVSLSSCIGASRCSSSSRSLALIQELVFTVGTVIRVNRVWFSHTPNVFLYCT